MVYIPEEPLTGDKRRGYIIAVIEDSISNILYYDRKEDEQLPRGSIEEAIRNGEVTVDELMHIFGRELNQSVEGTK